MTTNAATKADEKELKAEALKARAKEIEAKELELNKDRSGKGTRIAIGLTKGRNPQMVEYESFDESAVDTLPKTMEEFMQLSKIEDEPTLVSFLIDGFNASQYANATDPTSEYVEMAWADAVRAQFKMAVKAYAGATQVSIEDAVALIKPGFVAAHAAQVAKAAETASK